MERRRHEGALIPWRLEVGVQGRAGSCECLWPRWGAKDTTRLRLPVQMRHAIQDKSREGGSLGPEDAQMKRAKSGAGVVRESFLEEGAEELNMERVRVVSKE